MRHTTQIYKVSQLNAPRLELLNDTLTIVGTLGLPQDLVDWLKPTLSTSSNFTPTDSPPDFVAVGFQELLPLHLGFTGQSQTLLASRSALILKEIEKYSHGNVRYSLVASIVNVGVALLVYAKDEGVGRRVCDVQTSWTGCGPLSMGNKGAVAVRFRVRPTDAGEGETFTYVGTRYSTLHQSDASPDALLDSSTSILLHMRII